ncbi:MAG TPA: hypothetical protein VMU02_00820 [bacterium]|nr:hypothetical protein [bacterium]
MPNRTTICTTLSPGVTAAQINSAISGCSTNGVVSLAAGTYNLSGPIVFARNDVVLRGAGADQTKLVFSGTGGCGNTSSVVCFSTDGQWSGGPDHQTTWLGAGNPPVSGTYVQGATQVLLGSVSGLSVGQVLILDQQDDASDTGNVYICGFIGATCSSEGQASGGGRGGNHAIMQFAEVLAINGTTVTIAGPGIYMPTIRTGQSPGAWWATTPIKNAGIEDLLLDNRSAGAGSITVFNNAYRCWMKGIASIGGGSRSHVDQQYSAGVVIRDSYFWGASGANLSYGVETWMSGNTLVENNIFHHVTSPLLIGAGMGSVFGYNYSVDQYSVNAGWLYPSTMDHDPGTAMNLFEGNAMASGAQDTIHGSHAMATYFRNRFSGYDGTQTSQTVAFLFQSFSRYANVIGNVLGRSGYHNNYQSAYGGSSANCDTSIYNIGWGDTGCGAVTINGDPTTVKTIMRWGNYDVVSGTVRFVSTEVPSGTSPYGNAVPASQTLPASFYLTSLPTTWWGTPWGTPAWPPVGPDVTGGDVTEGSGAKAGLDGHAYKIPARLCYENTSTTSGIKNFNARNCYQTAKTAGLSAPTNLTAY